MLLTIMEPQSEIILDLVRERLAKSLWEQSTEEFKGIEILQVLPRPYSLTTFLVASTDRGRHRFVLKQIVMHPLNASVIEDLDQAAVEYRILTQLYPKFSKIERCAVPRPIAILPDVNAFLMEYVEGHILADDLKFVHYGANRTMFKQMQRDFYDCGRWLHNFQQFTGQRLAAASATDNVLLRCHDRLRVIEKSGDWCCPRDFRIKASTFIQKQMKRLEGAEILVAGRHGDFGPWNTLVSPKGITVIDFFGFRNDPLPVDIFSLLVYLESISYGIANSASRIRLLQERFLAGLGPIPETPQPLVLLCEAFQRIQQIAVAVITRGEGVCSRWELSRSLRVHVNWFLDCPETSSLWPG